MFRNSMVKKILKRMWNRFVYEGHLTSFGAISIALMTAILLGIKIGCNCLIIIYLGSEMIYLYDRHKELERGSSTSPGRTRYLRLRVKYIPLTIFLFILIFIGILIFSRKISVLIFGFLLVSLGLLYSIFIKKITRNIVGFKNFFVSLCWAAIVIFLALFYSYPLNLSLFLIFTFIYVNIFIHEALLDIKDMEEDRKENLLTLPLALNRKELYYTLFLLTILGSIPIVYGAYFHLLPAFSSILLFTIPYNLFVFEKINKFYRDVTYVEILADGGKILWVALVFLASKLL